MLRTNLEQSKEKYRIFSKMDQFEFDSWFGSSEHRFIHNIDTFYYSVFLANDWSEDTSDEAVKTAITYLSNLRDRLPFGESVIFKETDAILRNLQMVTVAMPMYEFHLTLPDQFDIFIARSLPNEATPQIHVQLRSEIIWLKGIKPAFEESLRYVKAFLHAFGLSLFLVQENRCDYCWHTNYFDNPYRFLNIDNIAKSVVSRMTVVNQHCKLKGNEDYEIDYVGLGNIRSHKVFYRMYLKCKEVIEMQKKGFFFQIWYEEGVISAYDKEVFEICYQRQTARWEYLYKAVLDFYLRHTPEAPEDDKEEFIRTKCQTIIDGVMELSYDKLKEFALSLCPQPTLVFNCEFATWRKFSSTFEIPILPQNIKYGSVARIYDYLDARKEMINYLTFDTVRFVKGTDANKARRKIHPFWNALRESNIKDKNREEEWTKLKREYNRNMNLNVQKNRMAKAVACYSVCSKGTDADSIAQDWIDAMASLNDNDMVKFAKHKQKRLLQLDDAAKASVVRPVRSMVLIDAETSEVLTEADYSTEDWLNQGDIDE